MFLGHFCDNDVTRYCKAVAVELSSPRGGEIGSFYYTLLAFLPYYHGLLYF